MVYFWIPVRWDQTWIFRHTHASQYNRLVSAGKWSETRSFCLFDYPMIKLTGKTMGLIGYGNLAKSVEHLAKAFGMQVLIAEQKGAEKIRPGRLPYEQVVREADAISIHCPLTDKTRDLFTTREFKQMKSSAIIINTARGGIINELDLVEALNSGAIAGAAIDVITTEPPPSDYPLIVNKPDNLIIYCLGNTGSPCSPASGAGQKHYHQPALNLFPVSG